MIHHVRHASRLAQKLFDVLLPETKRAVAVVDDWAVLGTLAGPVRAENQDRMVAGQFTSIDAKTFRIVALSDGMGGLANGQEAASLTLSSFLWCLTATNGDIVRRLERAARYANDAVFKEFQGKSGATLSAVVVTDQGFPAAVNVGDSRIYGYDRSSRALKQVSVDDTLAGLSGLGMAVDSRHNATALLQYVGMGDELEPNIIDSQVLLNMHYLMLSTDGIHWIGNKLLELIVQNAADHTQLARRLLQLAEMAGAHDNGTVGILTPQTMPPLAAHGSERMMDVEIWTPGGKTILMLEHAYQSENVSPSRNGGRQGPAAPIIRNEVEQRPVTVTRASTKRKPKRRKKLKPAPQEQVDLPMERPELVIEFGAPKREEDETSR